ncbi:MAG TPA: hypothetical protein VM639_22955 [Dongiaceae bacterium]|nr:hypothetical protein [Dongiaceae bacterium]
MCIVLAPAAVAATTTTAAAASSAAMTAAVTAAISAASIAATTMMQSANAAKQNAAMQKAATNSFNNKQQQEQTALIQKQLASQQDEMNSSIEAAKARATARASAGEAGVSGLSVDALINDYTATESRYRDGLRQNMEWETQQFKNRVEGHAVDSENMYNQNAAQKPSYLGAALRIGGSMASSYVGYQSDMAMINMVQDRDQSMPANLYGGAKQ